MTTRSEREKAQKLNEQHQAILSKLLREDDNKYCADCEAKGPRWASWNLGVFMCIRCAGIHRNLGVHISRVKSVNLDQWTTEQIQSMVDMGNSRARQVYEAHLPENFRRPQSDQAVEVFIRDKYERKRYFDKDALPPKSEVTASPSSQDKNKQEKDKKKEERKRDKETERNNSKSESRSPKKSPEPNVDLLGLDAPDSSGGQGSSPAEPISNELDLFGPMVSNPLPSSSAQPSQTGGGTAPPASEAPASTAAAPKPEEKKLMSKDSILSLYGSQPQGQTAQPAGTGQGVYVGQPQMQFAQGGSAVVMPNGGYMQPGAMATGQGAYGSPAGQQQWGINQMNQQMSGVALSGSGPSPGGLPQSGAPTVGYPSPAAPPSGQTLSTQLWK